MGCTNTKAKEEQHRRDEDAARDMAAAGTAPDPNVRTRGINPRATHVELGWHSIIKTNESAVYATAAPGTTVEGLFLYPVYKDLAGKRAAKVFGLPARPARAEPKPAAAAPAVADPSSDADESNSDSGSGLFGGVFGAVKHAMDAGFGGESATDLNTTARTTVEGGDLSEEVVPVATEGVICELKEFNSADDAGRRWYRHPSNGVVPGVLRLECGGPAAAWATLEVPNKLQQRWVMPNGHRRAGVYDSDPSVPQRILRTWRNFESDEAGKGNKFVRGLVELIAQARKIVPKEVLLAGHDPHSLARHYKTERSLDALAEKLRAEEVDIDATMTALLNNMSEDGLGSFATVHQMPADAGFDTIRSVLAFIESAFLANWFEVAVEAEFEIGTNYFELNDETAKRHVKHTLFDRVLKRVLHNANDMVEETEKAVRHAVKHAAEKGIKRAFAEETGHEAFEEFKEQVEELLENLYPDLGDIVEQDLATFDVALRGITAQFPASEQQFDPETLESTFREWRDQDSLPLETRRRRTYEAETARVASIVGDGQGGAEAVGKSVLRRPLLVPKHFHTVRFALVFPRRGQKNVEAANRKPNEAKLTLWPDGCRALEQTVDMTDLMIPNGGPLVDNELVEAVTRLYDDGDDSVSSDDDSDDPRAKWVEYPSHEWRGYECNVEVAMDVPYAFNFELDSVIFLDFNSFNTAGSDDDDGNKREHFRRVRFAQVARPATFNALNAVGLVA